jgi:hypothetical protein
MNYNFRERKFYALHINESVDAPGYRPSYFYLHGEAEDVNGYDICTANGEALSNCLRRGAFLCEVVCTDGSTKDAICFSYFKHGERMSGLICFLNDEESIEGVAKKESIFSDTPSMYCDEIDYLVEIGKYHLIKH